MSLNIESTKAPHAERLNSPNDVYIYFEGGFYVWNWNVNETLHVHYNGDMFTFRHEAFKHPSAAVSAFNEWVIRTNFPISEQVGL